MDTLVQNAGKKQERQINRRTVVIWSSMVAASAISFGVDVPGLGLREAFAETGVVDLGAGDIGVLNYAYALEQLEAAYYTQVLKTPYKDIAKAELAILRDIQGHEVAHRDFFRKALGGKRIPDLKPNFKSVDFSSRDSVLMTASTFEDLGVSAYNGGGAAIKNPDYLAAAGTIVSIEARHAAVLRDLLKPLSTSFGGDDVVDASGLDVARKPSEVLSIAAPFIDTPITAKQLP